MTDYCRSCGHYKTLVDNVYCEMCERSYYEQMSSGTQDWSEAWETWEESDSNPEG